MQKVKGKLLRRLVRTGETVLSLLVVFLLVAATAAMGGRLFGRDFAGQGGAGETAAGQPLPAGALRQLGLEGCRAEAADSAMWRLSAPDGADLGVVVDSRPLAADVVGFAGTVPVWVHIDGAGVVRRVAPQENAETPDFFRRAADGLLHRWDGLPAADAGKAQADAVSGATYSSNALSANVKAALAHYAGTRTAVAAAPVIGWARTACLLAVLVFGGCVAALFRGNKPLRILVLVLNIDVTGFWCGQFISFSLLRGWARNGLDPVADLPALALLAVVVVAAFLGRKGHYCNWACPLGSLQELAYRLPLPKLHVRPRTFRLLSRLRLAILSLLLLLLWMGFGVSLLDYEAFALFAFRSAPPAVIALALAFVVAGCFVPRPWCRGVCPAGELLHLAEEK